MERSPQINRRRNALAARYDEFHGAPGKYYMRIGSEPLSASVAERRRMHCATDGPVLAFRHTKVSRSLDDSESRMAYRIGSPEFSRNKRWRRPRARPHRTRNTVPVRKSGPSRSPTGRSLDELKWHSEVGVVLYIVRTFRYHLLQLNVPGSV